MNLCSANFSQRKSFKRTNLGGSRNSVASLLNMLLHGDTMEQKLLFKGGREERGKGGGTNAGR